MKYQKERDELVPCGNFSCQYLSASMVMGCAACVGGKSENDEPLATICKRYTPLKAMDFSKQLDFEKNKATTK